MKNTINQNLIFWGYSALLQFTVKPVICSVKMKGAFHQDSTCWVGAFSLCPGGLLYKRGRQSSYDSIYTVQKTTTVLSPENSSLYSFTKHYVYYTAF